MRATHVRREWIVAAAVLGILAGIALPQLVAERARAQRFACKNIFVALSNGFSRETPAPSEAFYGGTAALEVVRLAVDKHQDEDNPRNRKQRAYTSAPITPADAWQVRIEAAGVDRLLFAQYPAADEPLRTFSIAIPR